MLWHPSTFLERRILRDTREINRLRGDENFQEAYIDVLPVAEVKTDWSSPRRAIADCQTLSWLKRCIYPAFSYGRQVKFHWDWLDHQPYYGRMILTDAKISIVKVENRRIQG